MLAKSVKTGTFVWGCAGFDGAGAALTGVGMLWAICIRRQSFWVQRGPKLRERLAHLVGLIMLRAACDASGALRAFFV
jgi:hypothetical protein